MAMESVGKFKFKHIKYVDVEVDFDRIYEEQTKALLDKGLDTESIAERLDDFSNYQDDYLFHQGIKLRDYFYFDPHDETVSTWKITDAYEDYLEKRESIPNFCIIKSTETDTTFNNIGNVHLNSKGEVTW